MKTAAKMLILLTVLGFASCSDDLEDIEIKDQAPNIEKGLDDDDDADDKG